MEWNVGFLREAPSPQNLVVGQFEIADFWFARFLSVLTNQISGKTEKATSAYQRLILNTQITSRDVQVLNLK